MSDPAYQNNHHSSPRSNHSPQMFTYDSLPKTENGATEPRLIIVSNRLPVTITKEANGDYSFKVGDTGWRAF